GRRPDSHGGYRIRPTGHPRQCRGAGLHPHANDLPAGRGRTHASHVGGCASDRPARGARRGGRAGGLAELGQGLVRYGRILPRGRRIPGPLNGGLLELALIPPLHELPCCRLVRAGKEEVHVAVAAECLASLEGDGQVERTYDTGAQAVGEESLREDLIPTQVDERRVLEEAPRRFEFLREAPLALDLCIEVVVDEDEAGVDQRLV